jgi:hypothetical protein
MAPAAARLRQAQRHSRHTGAGPWRGAAQQTSPRALNSSRKPHNPEPGLVVYGSVRDNRTTGVAIQPTAQVADQQTVLPRARSASDSAHPVTFR